MIGFPPLSFAGVKMTEGALLTSLTITSFRSIVGNGLDNSISHGGKSLVFGPYSGWSLNLMRGVSP